MRRIGGSVDDVGGPVGAQGNCGENGVGDLDWTEGRGGEGVVGETGR